MSKRRRSSDDESPPLASRAAWAHVLALEAALEHYRTTHAWPPVDASALEATLTSRNVVRFVPLATNLTLSYVCAALAALERRRVDFNVPLTLELLVRHGCMTLRRRAPLDAVAPALLACGAPGVAVLRAHYTPRSCAVDIGSQFSKWFARRYRLDNDAARTWLAPAFENVQDFGVFSVTPTVAYALRLGPISSDRRALTLALERNAVDDVRSFLDHHHVLGSQRFMLHRDVRGPLALDVERVLLERVSSESFFNCPDFLDCLRPEAPVPTVVRVVYAFHKKHTTPVIEILRRGAFPRFASNELENLPYNFCDWDVTAFVDVVLEALPETTDVRALDHFVLAYYIAGRLEQPRLAHEARLAETHAFCSSVLAPTPTRVRRRTYDESVAFFGDTYDYFHRRVGFMTALPYVAAHAAFFLRDRCVPARGSLEPETFTWSDFVTSEAAPSDIVELAKLATMTSDRARFVRVNALVPAAMARRRDIATLVRDKPSFGAALLLLDASFVSDAIVETLVRHFAPEAITAYAQLLLERE